MASVTIHCSHGQSAQVYRHEGNPEGRACFRCRDCHHVLLLTYPYEARKANYRNGIQ
ncbi:TPA: hypothetical protein GND40_003680 [Salmonella enterica subsp. indica]|uniref:InsA N-terminal zinc ribbon domain-containing protein n=2 Tax=Salmonella enterica TaxID=28901 RepID=A0A753A859_SALER|nr:hypothetical protein [Salmonella enterica subsp. indica serovar 45:a:e,n,x]HAE8103572.1 hypothetical protein [Salmonella enterica subsp. indica serovar 45:a:e,n,x]HAF7947691.1 hypothetical protein [Salmonella enterica subsp. indica]